MKIKLRIGIGDIILSKSFLDEDVIWSLNYDLLGYRGNGYKEFITAVSKLIFHENRFTFVEK